MNNSYSSNSELSKIRDDAEFKKISLDLQLSSAGTPFFILDENNKILSERIFGNNENRAQIAKFYLKHFILNTEVINHLESAGFLTQKLTFDYFLNRVYELRKLFTLGIASVTMPNLQSLNPWGLDKPIILTGLDSMLIFRHILLVKSGLSVKQFEISYPRSEFLEEINGYIVRYSLALQNEVYSDIHEKAIAQKETLINNLLTSEKQYLLVKQ
jgi:hypothetical protein